MSLVLSRKVNEVVFIDRHIKVTVIKADNGTAKLAFDAPDYIEILREELIERPLHQSLSES